jgi:hypothetical protein
MFDAFFFARAAMSALSLRTLFAVVYALDG